MSDERPRVVWRSWELYAKDKNGRLPESTVKGNIRKFGIATKGAGKNRFVRFTPENLELFYDQTVIPIKLNELFGIESIPSQNTSSLEETIFTAEGEIRHVRDFSRENIDLETGVYLTARQIGILTGYKTEQIVRNTAEEDLGLTPRTFHHKTLWYLVNADSLVRFGKPCLDEKDLEEICSLAPIINHDVIAKSYGVSRSYVAAVASDREANQRFTDRVTHSSERLEYAVRLYRESQRGKVRDIIYSNVFEEVAKDLSQVVSEDLERYITPWLGLYTEVFGLYKRGVEKLKKQVKKIAERFILRTISDVAEEEKYEDLRRSDDPIAQWLNKEVLRYLNGLVGEELTIVFEEARSYLDAEEQEVILLRYKQGFNFGDGYIQPTFIEVGDAWGITPVTARNWEESAIEKLRQPELSSKIESFIINLNNYLARIDVANFKTIIK